MPFPIWHVENSTHSLQPMPGATALSQARAPSVSAKPDHNPIALLGIDLYILHTVVIAIVVHQVRICVPNEDALFIPRTLVLAGHPTGIFMVGNAISLIVIANIPLQRRLRVIDNGDADVVPRAIILAGDPPSLVSVANAKPPISADVSLQNCFGLITDGDTRIVP
jgi:hypothetical protein